MDIGVAGQGTRAWRIRSVLQALVLACVLPGIAAAVLLYLREFQHGRELLRNDLITTARAMQQTVDTQLESALSVARTLASFDDLILHDLPGFHAMALQVLRETGIGLNVVLSDRSGQQILNTLREPGAALPHSGNAASLQQVFSRGQPVVSPVYTGTGGLLQKPVLSVDVPVRDGDDIPLVLSLGILPAHFDPILSSQQFPPEWVAVIFDETGTIVARTHLPEVFVGRKGTAEYIRTISLEPEGLMQTVTVEGIPTASAWSRSPDSNWSVGIGIPRALLEQELYRHMLWVSVGFGALLLASLALAWLVARQVAAAFHDLRKPALAMATGSDAGLPRLRIAEAQQLALSMREAGNLLLQRQQALEESQRASLEQLESQVAARTRQLLETNRKLEVLAGTDMLTGLCNRGYADTRLRQEFLRFKRSGRPYVILYVDADHFKSVNDRFGHETGDQVLQQLAGLLQAGIRESDFVARYGGEEFLVQLADTDLGGARVLAERLRSHIAQAAFPLVEHLTVSIGMAQVLPTDDSQDAAIQRADAALYVAKQQGRDRVCPA